jgi:hypothetical protein
MQEQQHSITNSYLWLRVQFVGLNVVLCAVSNMGNYGSMNIVLEMFL